MLSSYLFVIRLFWTISGVLAQSVEHLTFNQVVRGSNPRCLIEAKKVRSNEKRTRGLDIYFQNRSFFFLIHILGERLRFSTVNVNDNLYAFCIGY